MSNELCERGKRQEVIEFNNVTKVYNGVAITKEFTTHIDKGEFVFITGPSGAGKSTVLRLLFCLERPDAGQIFFQGEEISNISRSRIPFVRRNIGFVFQDSKLLINKSVYDNISLVLRVTGGAGKEIEVRVTEALRMVGMANRIYAMPSTLSGGEQQRAAIARAIVNDPLLLLADEPTGNLDAESTWEIYQIFEKINRTGTTVVIATHDHDMIRKMEKRVISLQRNSQDKDAF